MIQQRHQRARQFIQRAFFGHCREQLLEMPTITRMVRRDCRGTDRCQVDFRRSDHGFRDLYL